MTTTIDRKAIETITGKLSFRCARLTNGGPIADASGWMHTAYRTVLTFEGGKKYSTTYRMGIAHTSRPQVQDVLHDLLTNASNTDQPFEAWAADLGYNSDSIKAHNTYLECVKCGQWLRASLTTEQIDQLSDLFQDY